MNIRRIALLVILAGVLLMALWVGFIVLANVGFDWSLG